MHGMFEAICHYCGETIKEGEGRAIAIVIGFPKHFCKPGENVELSCYYQWQLKKPSARNAVRSP